jgi:diguanylate cyclase (GGDEF)-like protein
LRVAGDKRLNLLRHGFGVPIISPGLKRLYAAGTLIAAREDAMEERNHSCLQYNIIDSAENRLKVLMHMARSSAAAKTDPLPSSRTRVGYYHPSISELIGCQPGEEYCILETLAEMDCVARELVDQVDLCPYCLHDNLRLRKLCSHCRSSLIVRKDILHHFHCGWAGVEEECMNGTDLVCPQCERQLRHLGVDYERTSQSYFCTACRQIFTEPIEEFLSPQCGRQIPKDGTMVHPVFAYSITSTGLEVARRGTFEGVPISRGIIDRDLNVYRCEYMDRRLVELVNRYLRYKAGFSLALISVDRFEEYLERNGHRVTGELMKVLASVLKGETRSVDLPGIRDASTFVLLLPQTRHKGALVFAKRFLQRVRSLNESVLRDVPTLSVAISSCPEDGDDAESMMATASERLAACRCDGGDSVKAPPADELAEQAEAR